MASRKVAVALSGGVDSAVCAALLAEHGYQVLGVTMHLYSNGNRSVIDNAREVAARLRIPHYVVNFSSAFEERVVNPFCFRYGVGQTPNPCVFCNRDIKFGILFDYVRKLGADYLATGHYARIKNSGSRYVLCKAEDPAKDQTYFLYTLSSDILPHLLFPVGDLIKTDVTTIAEESGLPVSKGMESHDICFMAGANYRAFLGERMSTPPGKILDVSGAEVGTHSGIFNYTIGQRQGINLGQSERLYVISIDSGTNSIVVGPESHLYRNSLDAVEINWISGCAPDESTHITAKIRYRAQESEAKLVPHQQYTKVIFGSPVKAVTPGQSIVFYNGDEVLGGGIIRS